MGAAAHLTRSVGFSQRPRSDCRTRRAHIVIGKFYIRACVHRLIAGQVVNIRRHM